MGVNEYMTHIYEEPSSLRVSDWEAFRERMRAEVARYPERWEAVEALASADRALHEIQAVIAKDERQAA
jgi:hypothetical protein